MLDIQEVVEARYPRFLNRHPLIFGSVVQLLRSLFNEARFKQFERDFPGLQGMEFVDNVLRCLNFRMKVSAKDNKRIAATGRLIIVANHPLGSLDGLALLHYVGQVRTDVKVVANDVLATITALRPLLLPVNTLGGVTARENLRQIRRHVEDEGALVIFPAGEVSRFGFKGVKDGAWQAGFARIATRTRAPILPVYVAGRNSLFFYILSCFSRRLSTLWLVREMFHQSDNTVAACVGAPIPWENYSRVSTTPQILANQFRRHVYRLARNAAPIFNGVEAIADPENRLLLRSEIINSELLGRTPDGKEIRLCTMESSPCVMREIGRLRELSFRAVGEGSGLPRDIDQFDKQYLQLVLWDPHPMEIAGAYRLGCAKELVANGGINALYTHSLFRMGRGMNDYLQQGLELGRSFVQPKYQTLRSLDYLWLGIGAYLRRYPRYRYLFGVASISPLYGEDETALISAYYSAYYRDDELDIHPRRPFAAKSPYIPSGDAESDLSKLRDALGQQGLQIPILFKHYVSVAEPGGVSITGFNLDPSFGHCVDGFVLVDLQKLKPRKRERYLDAPICGKDIPSASHHDAATSLVLSPQ
ncbi:MAG: lysophospholipid acyltransferase family protein [Haliea sp.]|nr:lysophospholipid acyltransferase family protein [Haliea sp.]